MPGWDPENIQYRCTGRTGIHLHGVGPPSAAAGTELVLMVLVDLTAAQQVLKWTDNGVTPSFFYDVCFLLFHNRFMASHASICASVVHQAQSRGALF